MAEDDAGIWVAIAHVDFSPRVVLEEAARRLEELSESAKSQDGVLGVTVLQQFARTNHYEVMGRFSSREAYFGHLSSDANRTFRGAIAPMLGSPHEDRLHRLSQEEMLPLAGIGAFVVVTQIEARPERAEPVVAIVSALADEQAGAPGFRGELRLTRRGRPGFLEVLSAWEEEDAFDRHLATSSARAALSADLIAPVDDRRHHLVHGPLGSATGA